MADRNISRPIVNRYHYSSMFQTVFKTRKPALLINIRVTMDRGLITEVESINVCDDLACTQNTCYDTNDQWLNQTYSESVSIVNNNYIIELLQF